MFKHFAAEYGWTPSAVLDGLTAGQFWLLVGTQPRTPHDPDRIRAAVNAKRLKRGMPPLPAPQPRARRR